jgi:carboxylesterase type B
MTLVVLTPNAFFLFLSGGTGAQLLPVILFIHGGAFVNGVPLVSCRVVSSVCARESL